MDWILREVTEIELQPDNINTEDSFSLSRARKPLIHDLKEWRLSYTKELTPSNGPQEGLTSSVLPFPLLMPAGVSSLCLAQSVRHSPQLACSFKHPSHHFIYGVFHDVFNKLEEYVLEAISSKRSPINHWLI
jgi:hypothetical protein